jgi:hypothetical protein
MSGVPCDEKLLAPPEALAAPPDPTITSYA